MATTIEDRMILLLNERARLAPREDNRASGEQRRSSGSLLLRPDPGRGYMERLAAYTRISVQRWRKVFHRRQRATPDMIEALARLFPHYAFWLVTGITDAANGHVAPDNAQTFPERLYAQSDGASQYFRKSLILFRRLFEESGVNLEDDHQRMYAAQRTRPLAHWHDSPLVDAAYRISQSTEYYELREIWMSREKCRVNDLKRIWPTSPDDRPRVQPAKDAKEQALSFPVLRGDLRTAHQDHCDLYYVPRSPCPTRFALSLLNTLPAELTGEELERLQTWLKRLRDDDLSVFFQYLEHHGIDRKLIFPSEPGTIRFAWLGMAESEIDRFVNYVRRLRSSRPRDSYPARTGGRLALHSGA
ncbi:MULTISPECIES: hypothetical protein [Paraburkholderia]|uniref:hypothetical protein n=1 Tax=Paraburkholderia TaxID=1822464 RepID=UPI002257F118|nr:MULTISPECIES: hypothetical protein [Paraburkholderia]MCX4159301.1 hypothetical protein [Paraburkholderia aspalathi]MDN7168700.1 hypothetical protein [Paraburkholderia sp. SECH2]MDQ6397187.1 hypothetical protein [Paraburkholderia aspalathi]